MDREQGNGAQQAAMLPGGILTEDHIHSIWSPHLTVLGWCGAPAGSQASLGPPTL